MKVGYSLVRFGSIDDVEDTVDRLELGVDSIWLPDHLMGYFHHENWAEVPGAQTCTGFLPSDADAWLDPFCAAGTVSRRTSLPIGTCVTDGTRRRAADMARSMLTLSQTAPGGFILGIGAGEAMSFAPFGYDSRRPIGNLETTLRELRSLLDTGMMPTGGGRAGLKFTHSGQSPQIWVAANGERGLALAGRYGEGWMNITTSAEVFESQRAVVVAAAEAAGRPAPISAAVVCTILSKSRDHVLETLERAPMIKLLAMLTPAALWEAYGLEHPAGSGSRGLLDLLPHTIDPDRMREIAPKIPAEMLEQLVMFGNGDEIAAKLRPFADAGVQHVVFTDLTPVAYPPPEANGYQQELAKIMATLREAPATTV
jgi:phthiodiolone/phenolphthiodiolone dimycocerosates ketoreductase